MSIQPPAAPFVPPTGYRHGAGSGRARRAGKHERPALPRPKPPLRLAFARQLSPSELGERKRQGFQRNSPWRAGSGSVRSGASAGFISSCEGGEKIGASSPHFG